MKLSECICSLALLGTTAFVSCTDPAAKLPEYDRVPPFRMIDSAGRAFDGSSLAGKVWVADFIYTSCPAECPMMTAKMHSVEKQVRGQSDVRLVSISVDPQHDTPAALTTFARRFGGTTAQWIFLTGTPETVHTLAFTTFHVGDVISKINHSTKFALVDKRGYVRGYYSTVGEDDLPKLLQDLETLRRASS